MLTGSTDISDLYNLTTLEGLFLDDNSLPMNFLENIRALYALKILSMKHCSLKGTLPLQGWCGLKNLEQVYMSLNELEGFLPACLGNLSSLQLFDAAYNQFVGNIGSNLLPILHPLNSFHFPATNFNSRFMNHSNLKFIACDDNNLIAEPSFQDFIPKFQLIFFSLSNCNSRAPVPEFPNFLYYQYDLRVLDLSHNNFIGMFPNWLLQNSTRLEQLYLRDNSFEGPLELPYHPNHKLSAIDLSNNKIHGQIPSNTCLVFPCLSYLRMANIGLTGSIPSCFGNMSSLGALDLADNQISVGRLEQLTSLWFLKLSNNNLEDQIPPSFFNSSRAVYLYLDGNGLRGQLGDVSSMQYSVLSGLDLSNNHLTGRIPRWIGYIGTLDAVDLSNNHFHGPIPSEFCNLRGIVFLDLSENNLFGSIPFCFNPPRLSYLHLYKNQFNGPLPDAFRNSSYLVTLDLAANKFSCSIPNWIGNLSSLSVLLNDNLFNGGFPVQLCLLEELSMLDISDSKLSGPLYSCLANLTFKENDDKYRVPLALPIDQYFE